MNAYRVKDKMLTEATRFKFGLTLGTRQTYTYLKLFKLAPHSTGARLQKKKVQRQELEDYSETKQPPRKTLLVTFL